MIRRAILALVAAMVAAVPASAQFSTKAQQEFAKGLTDDGFFGIPRYTTALLPPCTTAPAKGKVAFDTTAGLFKVCDGSAWVSVGGLSSPIAGDFVATGKWTFGSAADAANTVRLGETAGAIVFEGTGADAGEVTLTVADPGTSDFTVTIPAATTTLAGTSVASQIFSTTQTFTSGITLADNIDLLLGNSSSNIGRIRASANQTPDAPMLETGTLANLWLLAENADAGFDFAHAQQTNPTLFIHSANQSTTQFLGLSHDATYARLNSGTGTFKIDINGTGRYYFDGASFTAGSGMQIGFGSAADPTSPDAFFMRDGGAAAIQMGVDVNGAAVNQTLKAHDGITGTDILGGGLTLASGRGTGAAVSNPLTLNRQITKATGTTAQTYAPAVIHCPSKILSNTSATTTTVATITTTTTTGGNVTVDYGTLACSASTCDADGALVKVAWNNNAGTVAAAMTAVALQADSDATGNITTGPTVTTATNVVSIKATPVFTTIVPTTVWFTASYTVHSIGDTVVCQ